MTDTDELEMEDVKYSSQRKMSAKELGVSARSRMTIFGLIVTRNNIITYKCCLRSSRTVKCKLI